MPIEEAGGYHIQLTEVVNALGMVVLAGGIGFGLSLIFNPWKPKINIEELTTKEKNRLGGIRNPEGTKGSVESWPDNQAGARITIHLDHHKSNEPSSDSQYPPSFY